MNAAEYLQLLRVTNAQFKTATGVIAGQQAAKSNEIAQFIRWNGGDPTLWDYTAVNIVINNAGGNVTSTSIDFGREFFHKGALVRVVSTVGATPTCTYQIQGSQNNSTWTALTYSDNGSIGTFVNTTFVLTTATTVIKYVPPGQNFRYLSVATSANTNVTNTVDITLLG